MNTQIKSLELTTIKSIVEHAINGIDNCKGRLIHGCDLHNELFNVDYFIIGYHPAEQWLIANGGIFNAIQSIIDYEQSNFGTISTKLDNSESVCNMYTYILGEIILSESKTLQDNWDKQLTDKQLSKIVKELESLTK